MNARPLRSWLLLSTALVLLSACSREDAPSTPTSTAPTYLAVARGRIDVEGGLLKLGASRDGVVAEIKVTEGEQVKKGQLLATLDSELAQLAVAAALTEQRQVQIQAKQLARQLKFAEQQASRLTAAAKAGAGDSQSADGAHEAAERRPAPRLKNSDRRRSRREKADGGTLRTGATQPACAGRRRGGSAPDSTRCRSVCTVRAGFRFVAEPGAYRKS